MTNESDKVTIDFNQKNIQQVEHLLLPETRERLEKIRNHPLNSRTKDDCRLAALLVLDIIQETGIKVECRVVPVIQ